MPHIRVQFLSERDLVKLVQNGFMESLADAIRLWRHGFDFGVINVINRQIKLVIMLVKVIPP